MYFYLILHDNFCNFFSMIVKVHACQNLDAHLGNPCISQELATEKYPQLMFMVWSWPPQTWLWHVRPHQTPQRWTKDVDVKGLWSLNQQIWLLFFWVPTFPVFPIHYHFALLLFSLPTPSLLLSLTPPSSLTHSLIFLPNLEKDLLKKLVNMTDEKMEAQWLSWNHFGFPARALFQGA